MTDLRHVYAVATGEGEQRAFVPRSTVFLTPDAPKLWVSRKDAQRAAEDRCTMRLRFRVVEFELREVTD